MGEYMIETIGLTKSFGSKLAVDHVDMHVEKGDIYGFIGRNGAGKTTAMKLILGTLRANEGTVKLFGSLMSSKLMQLANALLLISVSSQCELSKPLRL